MPAKNVSRTAAADRGEQISRMVKELQGSKERSSEFLADPARVARQYGVTLSQEEVYAIRFVNSASLINVVGKLGGIGARAIFNNNCSCGGPVTTKTRPV